MSALATPRLAIPADAELLYSSQCNAWQVRLVA